MLRTPSLLCLLLWLALLVACDDSAEPDADGDGDGDGDADGDTDGDADGDADTDADADDDGDGDGDADDDGDLCEPVGPPDWGFHVTVDGAPEGDGSLEAPWDLDTALRHPADVAPGDTIWVHGGTYRGTFVVRFDGAEGAPITARAWPGDRVTLDSEGSEDPVVQIYHAWSVLRDLEVTNSDPDRGAARASGVYVEGDHVRLVNLVVHDTGNGIISNSGAGEDELALELEISGCLLYNNGWDEADRGHGHHLYIQNHHGTKYLRDNILMNAYGFGVHAYSYSDSHYAEGYEIEGNIWFLNGAPSADRLFDNCMVGHDGSLPVRRLVLRENYGWATTLDERDVRLGWDTANEDAALFDNYLVGQTIFQAGWASIELSGNTFVGPVTGVDPSTYPDNSYLEAPPGANLVVLRQNPDQPGRAHLAVYNWEGLEEVAVDLSGVIARGATYRVRNAQDYYGEPVLSGAYGGEPLVLPMTGLTLAQPLGDDGAIGDDERTGLDFNVFVVESDPCR